MEWVGYKGGEVASKLATESVRKYIQSNFDNINKEKEEILKLLANAIEYANMVVYEKSKEVQELEGWTLSSDKKTLTKEYNTATEETVVIKDIAGNETKVEIKVEIEEIYSEKYEIDNENRYILRVLPETTVNVFKTNISVKGTYKIVNSNGKEINGEEYITTGSKLITEDNKEYRISVIGDLNQSGTITLTDISMQRKHILELDILENEIYQAGDINKDGKITLDDLSKMRKIILGIEDMVS